MMAGGARRVSHTERGCFASDAYGYIHSVGSFSRAASFVSRNFAVYEGEAGRRRMVYCGGRASIEVMAAEREVKCEMR